MYRGEEAAGGGEGSSLVRARAGEEPDSLAETRAAPATDGDAPSAAGTAKTELSLASDPQIPARGELGGGRGLQTSQPRRAQDSSGTTTAQGMVASSSPGAAPAAAVSKP